MSDHAPRARWSQGLLTVALLAIFAWTSTLPITAQSRAPSRPTAALEGVTWVLDAGASGAVSAAAVDGVTTTLRLADGEASGVAGCNNYFAGYTVDGESLTMQSPLRFRIRPKALRVRIAHSHPGASPSAEVPKGLLSGLKALLRIAAGG